MKREAGQKKLPFLLRSRLFGALLIIYVICYLILNFFVNFISVLHTAHTWKLIIYFRLYFNVFGPFAWCAFAGSILKPLYKDKDNEDPITIIGSVFFYSFLMIDSTIMAIKSAIVLLGW